MPLKRTIAASFATKSSNCKSPSTKLLSAWILSQAENLKSRVRLALNGYDKNRLSYAKKELIGLLSLVESKRLDREFAKCAFDLEQWMVTPVNPTDPDLVPRNFRGDLIVQIRHILYMMDRMLGVTSP